MSWCLMCEGCDAPTRPRAPPYERCGADLQLDRGEFAAIMGPSGCGKSTLLNLVAGLDQADEGEIVLAGETVTGKSEDDLARMRRRHIGIVFQFFNLLEGMSVLENVVLPAMVAGLKRKQAEGRARDLLDLLGLGDKAKAAPGVALRRPAPAPRHRPGAGQRAHPRCWPTSRPAPSTPRAATR